MAAQTPAELYDTDLYTWTQRQAAALRRVARERVDTTEPVDWEHVAEEIEDMGKAQARELYSRYLVLLAHLLKWRHQPEQRSGGWRGTIVEQRIQLAKLLRGSPGLKPKRSAEFREAYADARSIAAAETGLPLATFPPHPPYTLDEAMDPAFWPDG
jgi:hypothetical protein